jgi:hypothetical protein
MTWNLCTPVGVFLSNKILSSFFVPLFFFSIVGMNLVFVRYIVELHCAYCPSNRNSFALYNVNRDVTAAGTIIIGSTRYNMNVSSN